MKFTRKGFTLAEVMIVVGIIAILAAIAIPNLLRSKVSANQTAAQAALKSISTAMENYFSINSQYPSATTDLTAVNPPYLNNDFFTGVHNGYAFTSTLSTYEYSIVATPQGSNFGTRTFTISTGGVLTSN